MADLLGMKLSGLAEQQMLLREGNSYSRVMKSRSLLDQLRSGARGTDPEATRKALRDVSTEFEAVFMNQLVSAMRKTVVESGLIHKSEGEKIWEGMLDQEWARALAGRHGPSGLSELIYRQLSHQMGLEDESPPSLAIHPLLTMPTVTIPTGLNVEEK